MMKRTICYCVLATALLMMVGCGSKAHQKQTFEAADGSVTATVKNGQWTIKNADGTEVVADYDSMRVVEVGEDGHPMTIVYYKGNEQLWLQYYTTMQLRSEGRLVNGLREGRWVTYHANGKVQSECDYVGGREDGNYRVYRENGAPYYIGQYENGKPVGTWEIYDALGNLAGTKEY